MADFETLTFDAQLPLLHELAVAAMALYEVPPVVGVTLVNLSENATYRVDAVDGQRWAVRIHRDGYHSRVAIASELAWLMDLRKQDVVITPKPVAGKNGEIIQNLAHATMARPRHIVLFEWEQGIEPLITDDLQAPFEALGEAAARMHIHARTWLRPSWFERHTWNVETSIGDNAPHWGRWRNGIGVTAELANLFARTVSVIERRLSAYGQSPRRFGLVHGDLRLANLLMDGPRVKVIDFDDSGFSWFMYDAATPVSFYEHEPLVPELIEHWKTGYRKVAVLSKEDEAEIPTFIMLRRLLLVAWTGSRRDTDLAKSMGQAYTEGTAALCEAFLVVNS
jgi:Ser/Thr protein kinase RdoA (MazF antagonist)